MDPLQVSVNIEDLRKNRKNEMKKIINENIKIERVEVLREEQAKTVSRNERPLEI